MKIDLRIKDSNSLEFGIDKSINGLNLKVHDFQGQITGSFSYKVLFVTAKGDFKVTFDQGALSLSSKFPLKS